MFALAFLEALEREDQCIVFDLAKQHAGHLRVEHEKMLELEHFTREFLGELLVQLADCRHHAFLDAAVQVVYDLGSLLHSSHGERCLTVHFLDLGGDRLFKDFNSLTRDRSHPGDPMEDWSMEVLRQCRQSRGGDFGIELKQQDSDCLGVFLGQELANNLGLQPTQNAQGRKRVFLPLRRDLTHQIVGLDPAHRGVEHIANVFDPAVVGNSRALGRFREPSDGISDFLWRNLADRTHLAGKLMQLFRRQLPKNFGCILFCQQHDHNGRLVGTG